MSSHQKYNYNDCEYKQRWRNKCKPLLLAASLAIGAICHPQPENIGGEGRGPIRHNGERFPFPDLVCSVQPFLFSYYEGICRVSSCVSAIFSSLHFLQKSFLFNWFGQNCSSQPSMVHWLSSSIFPCSSFVPLWWHPTKSPLFFFNIYRH